MSNPNQPRSFCDLVGQMTKQMICRFAWLSLLTLLPGCSSFNTPVDTCPAIPYNQAIAAPPVNFPFKWTNRRSMIDKVVDRVKRRNKLFLRLKTPILYAEGANYTWIKSKNESDIWVWVAVTHEYMLYFPHNFNVLSLGTMGIITQNFLDADEISGECHNETVKCQTSAPRFRQISGECHNESVKCQTSTPRCRLTWKDIWEFMSNVTAETKTEWNLICTQLNYDVAKEVEDPNFALPDVLYYVVFLRQFFTNRTYFGLSYNRTDFVHYHCYKKDGELEQKQLLRNYYVIVVIALVLWSYSPLLIYFFPSSQPHQRTLPAGLKHSKFRSIHKSPVHFGYLIKCLLCFYIGRHKTTKARIRRVFFVISTFGVLIRLFYTRYSSYVFAYMLLCIIVAVIPDFWSVHLDPRHPTHFLNVWKYPDGVFRKGTKSEYQLLAHNMKERLCLVQDVRFWEMIFSEMLAPFFCQGPWIVQLRPRYVCAVVNFTVYFFCSCITLVFILLVLVYHLVPAFYFYKEIFCAIISGLLFDTLPALLGFNVFGYYGPGLVIITFSIVGSFLIVAHFVVVTIFACYLIAEVTMFTYIGAVLDPSMAFKYFTLVGAFSLVVYKLIGDLTHNYETFRNQIVETLKNSEHRLELNKEFSTTQGTVEKEESESAFKIIFKKTQGSPEILMFSDHFDAYISRALLDFCIEQCDPLRRRIVFLIVKITLITFYLSVALWVKNVFHKEKEVSSIFTVVQTIPMYFIPNLLQILAHRNPLGDSKNIPRHRKIHKSVASFIKTL